MVPPPTPRSVRFSVAVRADAPEDTRVRNVATVIFPDAVPPSRIDTNFVEHVVIDPPTLPVEATCRCWAARPGGGDQWRVRLVNDGYGFAYNVTATILDPPAAVQVRDGDGALLASRRPRPGDLRHPIVARATTTSTDTVAFTTLTPAGDPCAGAAAGASPSATSPARSSRASAVRRPTPTATPWPTPATTAPPSTTRPRRTPTETASGDACEVNRAAAFCGAARASVPRSGRPTPTGGRSRPLGVTDPDGGR